MSSFETTLKSRRTFLRSSGMLLSLPFLESFASAQTTKVATPRRLVFLGGGYGFTEKTFYPTKAGKFSKIGIPQGLKPMEKHINDLTMVANLFNPQVKDPHGGSSNYLSGGGRSVSCDQVAGAKFASQARFPSLVLTALGDSSGHGRGGLSLATSFSGKPISGTKRPLDLYHKLFANGEASPEKLKKMLSRQESILDIVSKNGISMQKRIAKNDKERMEEYFESIRDVELKLKRQAEWADVPKPKAPFKAPGQEVGGVEEIKLMLDMIISIDAGISGHAMSHYKFSASKTVVSETRDEKLMELLAYFVDRLQKTEDREGMNLYETTMISFGSNLRTGHTFHDCPALLVGGAKNQIKKGEHIMLPELTPLSSYWLTILQQSGIELDQFNDSKGPLGQMLS